MSKIEVNAIEPQCGTNLTVGASGDTITFPSGTTVVNNGSQTGFGRTGTVDWDTTAKTASFTAVSGNGYFVNTTSGTITLTLPASPSAGDIVGVNDYARNFATNNLTVARNGSNIQGVATDATVATNGQSTMFVYVDATKGWIPTEDQTTGNYGELFITATGGTITTCGNYKIHTFTSPGTFCVSCAGNPAGSDTLDYLVIAGGGGGGRERGGGGGAGGYRESSGAASGCYSISPLGACVSALPVTASPYPVTVGAGGADATGICNQGSDGSSSSFAGSSTITSTGGGGGGSSHSSAPTPVSYFRWPGRPGGSGGGASGYLSPAQSGTVGNGNTPPVSPPQGNNGGLKATSGDQGGGGGGGATAVGADSPTGVGGAGGNGATSSINGTPTARAGGAGGGSTASSSAPQGGSGGGGNGGYPGLDGVNGTTNSGSGGGGASSSGGCGGNGASGIVIIRYKYQ
jgi:hypothetical protein